MIIPRSDHENRVVAERFKSMLETDDIILHQFPDTLQSHESYIQPPFAAETAHQAGYLNDQPNRLTFVTDLNSHGNPKDTFLSASKKGDHHTESTPVENNGGQTDYLREQSNHIHPNECSQFPYQGLQGIKPDLHHLNPNLAQFLQKQPVSQALASGLVALKRDYSPRASNQPLRLPGMGDGRQRDERGRNLLGGQKPVLGIPGDQGVSWLKRPTTVATSLC